MMMLSEASLAMGGQLMGEDRRFESVEFDTRRLAKGAVYFAIHGESKNGHEYIDMAMQREAIAAVCDEAFATEQTTRHIKVDDTTFALGQLAAHWRARFTVPVIGITGSNGKTTVSQIVNSIFSEHLPGVAPRGSFNNQWGVPLTLLELRSHHRSAIIEMGMNHPGELTRLGAIVKPSIALITNAAAAHLEGLKTIEGVAKAKGELIDCVAQDGIVVLNRDDRFYDEWRQRAIAGGKTRRIVSFGTKEGADVRFVNLDGARIGASLFGEYHEFEFALVGQHNALNAMAAIAVALSADVPVSAITRGLANAKAQNGRLQTYQLTSQCRLIDDSYNANLASMRAAIDVLASHKGQTILVLGAMGELGANAETIHKEVGQYAQLQGIDHMITLVDQPDSDYMNNMSAYASGFGKRSFALVDIPALLEKIKVLAKAPTTILVKGSRFAQMERVVEALRQSGEDAC